MAKRKKEPVQTNGSYLGVIEGSKSDVECLLEELQSWLDNLPENLQQGQKGEELQAAIDDLQSGIEKLEEIVDHEEIEKFSEINVVYTPTTFPPSTYLSRARRMSQAVDPLRQLPELEEGLSEVNDLVSEAIDYFDSVEFPAMR